MIVDIVEDISTPEFEHTDIISQYHYCNVLIENLSLCY
jgi:hypothetical protein